MHLTSRRRRDSRANFKKHSRARLTSLRDARVSRAMTAHDDDDARPNALQDISTSVNATTAVTTQADKPCVIASDDGASAHDAKDDAHGVDASEHDAKRARDTEDHATAHAKKSKDANIERAPAEIAVELPEPLTEWKTTAEHELAALHTFRRAKLLYWFHVKGAINTCIISCPADPLRKKMREMRDNGVYGSSMVPYLQLMREIFDTCGEYVDDLDEEMDPNDFWDDESEEDDDDEDEEDEEEDDMDEDEEIPVVSRGGGRAATTVAAPPAAAATARGASRSAPSNEEMASLQLKFREFQYFFGQYFSTTRKEKEGILELLDEAKKENFDDEIEVSKFLDIMQRQNKIMIDDDDNSVYII